MLTPNEITRGLVLRFDPPVLAKLGAVVDNAWMAPVRGVHYFVCISRVPGLSVWVPAYSRQTSGRVSLRWKGGEPEWVEPDSFVDASQMWFVPDRAIEPASRQHERTRPGHRNYASLFFLLGGHLESPNATDPPQPAAA